MFVEMKAKQKLREMTKTFSAMYDASEAEAIAMILLECYANVDRSTLIRNAEKDLSEQEENDLLLAEKRIMEHEPVQYVTGETYFFGKKFSVSNAVLIPRPETEELVHWMVADCQKKSNLQVIDIGTGSGCIAISLQLALPQAKMLAIDLSTAALAVAEQNAQHLQSDIQFQQMNFLMENEWEQLDTFDVIISNPPYIPASIASTMESHVVNREPHLALFVPDTDPLIFYRKIAAFGKVHLKEEGMIFMELHAAHAYETEALFRDHHYVTELRQDIYGQPRMLKATQRP